VDIEFSDGTRLSDLEPRDQYGFPADARGQGESKVLYADQWNDIQVSLDVAVGRTITSVLLAADAPTDGPHGRTAPATLKGWVETPHVETVPSDPPLTDLPAWVDTRRGTNASGDFSRGNNLPLTALPNGFAFLTPATDARTHRWVYEYLRANGEDARPRFQGLAISHQPSPWMGDRNQLFLMPLSTADPQGDPAARALAFDHREEVARPDRYSVPLADGTLLEAAPTDHGLFLQTSFAEDAEGAHLLIEGVDEQTHLELAGAVFDGTFTGWVENGGSFREAGRTRMYLAGTLDPQPTSIGPAPGGLSSARVATFPAGTRTVTVRLATSFIGTDQARRTLGQELIGRSLADVQRDAHAAWQERLSVITVDETATPPQRRTLYGNLYRLNLYPNSQFENVGTKRAPRYQHASPVLPVRGQATDTRTNAQVVDGELFVNNGFWDTYRTAWPAYTLLYPELCARLVDGFVQHHREGGWIPRWSSPGYADCMTGTSSDVAFADAQIKGVPLPDPVATYESGLRNATVAPTDPLVGRKGVERGFFTGYVDTDTDESVSWALEAHINDFGLAAQARALADSPDLPDTQRHELREEAEYLASRALNYTLLFDPAVNFFQGRRPDGDFAQDPDTFDPRDWGGDFTETDGWNFAFHVPHDGAGLAWLYGGPKLLRDKLDAYFSTEETGDRLGGYGHVIHEMIEARAVRMGQFGVSNQPAHHIPFLYHHAGAPERAQEIVREAHQRLFVGEQIGQGYPGDEDNGEMSAWWLFTVLGLYPLQLGTGIYHLVAPLFERAEVRPLGGTPFTVLASGQAPDHPYVHGLARGDSWSSTTWIAHEDLEGELRFVLGDAPREADEAPPSLTPVGEQPKPLRDLLGSRPDLPLLDDDSRTEQAWPMPRAGSTSGAGLVIDLPVLENPGEVRIYTLTSSAQEGADPVSWRLEGRSDSGEWEVLDQRTDQIFRWRRQTRPFVLAEPAPAQEYRLVVTKASGSASGQSGARVALAELELLGRS
jgi:predicted alpha-1,2-mannosidase